MDTENKGIITIQKGDRETKNQVTEIKRLCHFQWQNKSQKFDMYVVGNTAKSYEISLYSDI